MCVTEVHCQERFIARKGAWGGPFDVKDHIHLSCTFASLLSKVFNVFPKTLTWKAHNTPHTHSVNVPTMYNIILLGKCCYPGCQSLQFS